jgi:hypothetical protein
MTQVPHGLLNKDTTPEEMIALCVMAIKTSDPWRSSDRLHYASIAEGMLTMIGYIKINTTFDYHMIETWNPSPFAILPWVKKTRIRKESYVEMMLRTAEEYLKEQNHV